MGIVVPKIDREAVPPERILFLVREVSEWVTGEEGVGTRYRVPGGYRVLV